MKAQVFMVLSTFLLFGNAIAQKTGKKELKIVKKEMRAEAVQDKMDALIMSKEFEFIANIALPLGMAPKNLVGNNYSIRFTANEIVSDLPYFGTVRSGITFGRDKGMRFKGVPTNFEIEHPAKKYIVTAKVETDDGIFNISMIVSNSGYATLAISSRNKDTISYQGEVR